MSQLAPPRGKRAGRSLQEALRCARSRICGGGGGYRARLKYGATSAGGLVDLVGGPVDLVGGLVDLVGGLLERGRT